MQICIPEPPAYRHQPASRQTILEAREKIRTDHDGNCNCCCCCSNTPQRVCYRYVQPEVPKSFAPIRYYWKSGLPMEKNTTYGLSYWECPRVGVDPFVPQNCLVTGDGAISDKTTYNCSFYEQCAKPEAPIVPCERDWLGRGPMQDVTTQKHDFTWKLVKPLTPHKVKDNIYTFPNRLADDTTYRLSYFQPDCSIPSVNYAPIRSYLKPDVPMDDNTTYRLSYWPNDCSIKEDPIFIKPEYIPPSQPMDGCTTYKLSFWPQTGKKRSPIRNQDTENVLNAGCCNDPNTTYNLSYYGCGGDKSTPIRQPDNITCSPCPLDYDTIHKMSFLGNWCAKPAEPITPCSRDLLGRGPMQDVTTQKHDFTWKNTASANPLVRPSGNFIFPAVPIERCTTYKLSYFENDRNALTPTQSYAPIRTYLPSDIPAESETTMQLSYQPVDTSSVEKPSFKQPSYHPPVHPMDDHTIYNTSYIPPGTLCP